MSHLASWHRNGVEHSISVSTETGLSVLELKIAVPDLPSYFFNHLLMFSSGLSEVNVNDYTTVIPLPSHNIKTFPNAKYVPADQTLPPPPQVGMMTCYANSASCVVQKPNVLTQTYNDTILSCPGADRWQNGADVIVDYNTADPLIRWDSYQNICDGEGTVSQLH